MVGKGVGRLPRPVGVASLQGANDLDANSLEFDGTEVGPDPLGRPEVNRLYHLLSKRLLDRVCPRFGRLNVDVVGLKRDTLQGKTRAPGEGPVEVAVVEVRNQSFEDRTVGFG